jgi:broad specificity phosphatase PhoE
MLHQTRSNPFFLIRHAESGLNHKNCVQGHSDSLLTPKGKMQVKRLIGRFRKKDLRKIYTSDLGRALKTSLPMADALNLEVIREPHLREIRLGAWEGLNPEEINQKFRNGYQRWLRSPSRMRIPGGERMHTFHERVRRCLKRILRNEKSGGVAIITHGGVICSLLAHWMKANFDDVLLGVRIDNTSLTFCEQTPERIRIHVINDVSHLNRRERHAHNLLSCSD